MKRCEEKVNRFELQVTCKFTDHPIDRITDRITDYPGKLKFGVFNLDHRIDRKMVLRKACQTIAIEEFIRQIANQPIG